MRRAINFTLRIITIAAVLVSSILVFIVYCINFSSKEQDYVRLSMNEAVRLITDCDTEEGTDLLEKVYGNSDDLRVTYIAPDGHVLYDNATEWLGLESHMNRSEVRDALEYGEGESERKSDTLGEKIYYYAVKTQEGNILRLSRSTNIVFHMILSIVPLVLLILLVVIAASFVASKYLTQYIMEPINNIDIDNIDKAEIYDELQPFFSRIVSRGEEKERSERMRREFTANVSHELKTPLTTISGYAQMINNGMARPEDTSEFGRKIEKESDRLLTLIDDIINLSNLDESSGIENPERIDLSQITEEAICVIEKPAKERDIQIYYSKTPAFIDGNSTLLGELVYNLLDNAVKYNKDNGKITVFVGENADGVELSVKDTGIGIPEGDTERIFERFYRVDKSHSKKVGGTGLGLSIVKHVCACHDAKIVVKSKVGEGTTVYVTFRKAG